MTIQVTPEQNSWRQQQIGISGILRRWWNEAEDYQKFFARIGFLMLALGAFHAGVWAVQGGSWLADVSWRKPTLFYLSAGVSAVTAAWVMRYLAIDRHKGWQITLNYSIPGIAIGSLMALQQWRGARSHFNFNQSPFDAAVATVIIVLLGLLIPAALVLTIETFRSLRAPRSLALAIRSGMVFTMISFGVGVVTIVNAATVGLLFTLHSSNLVGASGAMKVPHGIGIHGIQILLGIVALLQATRWSEARRTQVVGLAVLGYGGLLGVSLFQMFSGVSPLALNLVTVAIVGTSLLLLALACTMALGARLFASRSTLTATEQP